MCSVVELGYLNAVYSLLLVCYQLCMHAQLYTDRQIQTQTDVQTHTNTQKYTD